jgi:outer membrane beta-barrel protein
LDIPRHTFAALLLLLSPLVAVAQPREEPGLDLSQPPPPQESPPGEAGSQAPPQEGAKPPEEGAKPHARAEEGEAPIAPGARDGALGDRVKAVQRKGFLKRHRFEVGIDMPATLNDAFYEKVGVGGKVAYNFADSFALALRGTYLWQVRSSHAREGKMAFSSQLLSSRLHGQAMLDAVWSPVYGKIAWLGSSIVHFDMYLLAGGGLAWSDTSIAPRNEGPHVAADFGGGVRFYPTSWLALDGGVVATFYPDQPNAQVPSTLQKVIVGRIGFSVFFPTNFEYVYP